jgi:hypothetical protein
MSSLFDPVQDALGGGNLSLWLLVGGVVLVWLAVKAVKFVVRLALVGIAVALVVGTAPWGGQPAPGAAADCAEAAVAAAASGWQSHLTKRVTADEVSPDAACAPDGVGLAGGSAVVRLRSFYDAPFQTWDVTPSGAVARLDLPAG